MAEDEDIDMEECSMDELEECESLSEIAEEYEDDKPNIVANFMKNFKDRGGRI